MNNIDIYHEKHWLLPVTALSFTMKVGICHEQHRHFPWTLVFVMNNIDICHEHADVYNTWRKNLVFKTTNKF
jgi:hypothetical protein